MAGDFSRLTFDPTKHYSGVRWQQGRVQLDADWNEQADIADHRIRIGLTDLVGPSGAPADNAGFQLSVVNGAPTAGRGRYYVGGLLIENEADVALAAQPDYPGSALSTNAGIYLAYLDVWQRPITALEDPSLLDPALGGVDTTTRLKNVWLVALHNVGGPGEQINPADYAPPWRPSWEQPLSTGTLAARVAATGANLENQLYRVEIHDGGAAGAATFVWSRDNGAVAAAIVAGAGTGEQTLTISSARVDALTSFAANQWVEVTDDEHTLHGLPGTLAELASVQGNVLTVKAWPNNTAPTLGANPIVRRWDSPGAAAIPAAPSSGQTGPTWLLLEDSIEVAFSADAGAAYKTGDYWLIPARTATGVVAWPLDANGAPLAQPPRGVLHQYCALGALTLNADGVWGVAAGDAGDLRVRFSAIATGLLTKAGGEVTGSLSIDGGLTVAGAVGIGTTAPSAKLTIDPQGPGGLVIGHPSTSSGGFTSLSLDISAASDGYASVQAIQAAGSLYGLLALNPSGGNVGVGTTTPAAKLEINGDLAFGPQANGPARALLAGGTLIWNDGTWLRLNENLDYSKPVGGVITPGLLAAGSLSVGGLNNWADPGQGNVTISGNVGIGAATPQAALDVRGTIKLHPDGSLFAPGGTDNLMLIWGHISWSPPAPNHFIPTVHQEGSGFTATVVGVGGLTITFTRPFTGLPALLTTVIPAGGNLPAQQIAVDHLQFGAPPTGGLPPEFTFVAVGPR